MCTVVALESQSKAKSVGALRKYQEAKAALANSPDNKGSPGSDKKAAPPPKVDLYK